MENARLLCYNGPKEMIPMEIIEKLKKRGFLAEWFDTAGEAADFVAADIGSGKSVGIGGSVTIRTLGLDKRLADQNCAVHWHWTAENKSEALAKAQQADVYLCSANAIDSDGILYNIDGTGNRVSALAFGPGEVYVIAGVNKLVQGSMAEAIDRIKTEACGKNARRLGLDTPCARLDRCVGADGCRSAQRMCKVTSRTEFAPGGRKFHVILVNEPLGY